MSPTLRRVVFGAVVVATLALGVVLGAVLFADDDDDAPTVAGPSSSVGPDSDSSTSSTSSTVPDDEVPTAPSTIPEEGLSGDALAFAVALNQARDMSYHARYEGQGQRDDGTVTDLVVEVWRRQPLARRDFIIAGGGEQVVSREYQTTAGVTGCLDTTPDDVDDFQCTDATGSGSDPAAPAFGAVDPRAGEVTAVDDTVDGVSARCYRVTPAAGSPQEVCFDRAGVPLVVDDGDYRLVRVLVDDVIDDADFEVPQS